MRTLTLALVAGLSLTGFSTAQAADLDYGVLRGPDYEPELRAIDWNGVYVGAHAGYTSTSQSYKNKFSDIINDYFAKNVENSLFRDSVELAGNKLTVFERRADGTSFGGFVGYNYQFDDAVIGVEFDYSRLNAAGQSQYAINTNFYDFVGNRTIPISVNGIASTEIIDYGTARVRAGYAVGSFLPFVTGGLAIGRAKIGQQVVIKASDPTFDRTISDRNVDGTTSNGFLGTYTKTKVVGGFTLGAGLEFALTENIILRGEYQYILFDAFSNSSKNTTDAARGVNMNTVRAGAAVKF